MPIPVYTKEVAGSSLSSTQIYMLVGAYVLFAVATFGHLFRSGDHSAKRLMRCAAVAIAWPLYWIIIHGVRNTIQAVGTDFFLSCYGVAGFFTLAYYIGMNVADCAGWGCFGTIGMGLLWAMAWPVYVFIHT